MKELNFFYKVRKKLSNDKLYTEFLKCLNLFSSKIITRIELVRRAPFPE
jgi:histone deacetylase complex regulatory component SIN3